MIIIIVQEYTAAKKFSQMVGAGIILIVLYIVKGQNVKIISTKEMRK